MDGLSVAGTAIGVISLGIQVTQSLVDFYSAYKNQKNEVSHTINRLTHLLSSLEILKDQLGTRRFLAEEQALLQNIQNSIQDCDEYIHELQDQCDKLMDSSSDSIRAAARTAARRLAYPFRQSTLQTLEETIDEMVSHLLLALQILQQKDISNVHDDIQSAQVLLDCIRISQISSEIRQWLKPPDASSNYYESIKKRYQATGLWFVQGPSFATWLTKPDSLLWLHGFAGCGKSVLCSTVIQHTSWLQRLHKRNAVAFFFFTFNDSAKQDTSAMLRALVFQLSCQLGDNHVLLARFYNDNRDTLPSNQALIGCLQQLLQEFDNTYIILDALDESIRGGCRGEMLQTLADLRAKSTPGLHILATSRDEPDIRDALIHDVGVLPDEIVSLKNNLIDSDIAAFVSGSLKSNRQLRKWEKYHQEIETALTERAMGVFRWVECQFTALESCARSKRHLDALLASLPQSLDKTYERMLLRISNESKEDARRILTMLCCAKTPLTVLEVIEGLAVELGEDPRFNPDGRLDDEEDIHRICPGLVEIDHYIYNRKSTVRIAHFSVQEYLESDRICQSAAAAFAVRIPEAHAEMACICLTYMRELHPTSDVAHYPLAKYAAKRWFRHYHDGDPRVHGIEREVVRLFRNKSGELDIWRRIWDARILRPLTLYAADSKPVPLAAPIFYASLLGLDSIILELLSIEETPGVVELTDWFEMALEAASGLGHEKAVRILLEKVINVGNALQAALRAGHDNIARLLCRNGRDFDGPRGMLVENLIEALHCGDETVVRFLIKKSKEVNRQVEMDKIALDVATRRGDETILQMLLEDEIHLRLESCSWQAALEEAALAGRDRIMRMLLEKQPEIEEPCTLDGALHAAALGGHGTTIQLLLERGANIDVQGGYFGAAIHIAWGKGHEKVVKLLINRGVDVNVTGSHGRTALSWAAARGHISIVKLLLANTLIRPNQQDRFGRPAMFYAARTGQRQVLEMLLAAQDTDINHRDCYGSTPLSVAVRGKHNELADFLLSLPNIDIGVEDNFGRTPFWWAINMENTQIANRLTQLSLAANIPTDSRKSSLLVKHPALITRQESWCDICMIYTRSALRYRCRFCDDGAFCICSDCFQVGGHCLDNCHILYIVEAK